MADFTDSADFELLPANQAEIIDADTALDAAEASALDDPLSATNPVPPVIPFGRTAPFDYKTGRFIRLGDGAIPWVSGKAALREWIYAALQTGRGGSPLFNEDFGFERLNSHLGKADPTDELATFEERLRDCVVVHDRVEDIDDYEAESDPRTGVVTLKDLTIITDEAEALQVGNFETTEGV